MIEDTISVSNAFHHLISKVKVLCP